MNAIKSKLLDALSGMDIRDIGEEALVDILVNKIKALEENIEELKSENCYEKRRLHESQQELVREHQRLREDPLYGAQGYYCFRGEGSRKYKLDIQGGCIRGMTELNQNVEYWMQAIPPSDYFDALQIHKPTKRSKN